MPAIVNEELLGQDPGETMDFGEKVKLGRAGLRNEMVGGCGGRRGQKQCVCHELPLYLMNYV